MACRVLLVDDNSDFRRAARQLLERHGFVVVAEAKTGIGGIERTQELRPDVVLVDVQLPDIDGFEVAARLSQLEVPPAVILTSSLDGADFGALVAGSSASGFVAKAELSASAIRRCSPRCADSALSRLRLSATLTASTSNPLT